CTLARKCCAAMPRRAIWSPLAARLRPRSFPIRVRLAIVSSEPPTGEEAEMPDSSNTYDFIVTGAGSAGCAVAGRLSESGKYRVLLLEAGTKDTNPWIHVPLGYTKTYTDPRVNWMFDSEP